MRGHQRPQRRQDAHVGGGERPHRQIAGAAVGGLLRQATDVFDATEDVLGLAEEHAARVGQRHVVTAAIEQQPRRPSDSSWRICWLSDGCDVCRRLARAREVQLLCHRHEVPQMPEFHPTQARRRRTEWQPARAPLARHPARACCRACPHGSWPARSFGGR